jgi:DNA-binding NarL/FixJ family response regulator
VPESTITAAAALDAIEEGVLVQDAEQIVYANRAAGELLGLNRDHLRGLAQLAPPCDWVSESGAPASAEEWPVADALRTGDEVAKQLGISPATVRVHLRNAAGKLGASTRVQAVAIAVARGEIDAP